MSRTNKLLILKFALILFPILCNGTALRGSLSPDTNDNAFQIHRPRHLSQVQFEQVWSSEAEHEFHYDSDGVIWETMMDLTWDETLLSGNSGFVVCSELPATSGYDRSIDLEAKLSSTMVTLYNSIESSCYLAYLDTDVVQSLHEYEYIQIHPMNAIFKFRQGMIDSIIENQNDDIMEFEIQSCSSNLISSEEIENILASHTSKDKSRRNLSRRVSDRLSNNLDKEVRRRLSSYSPRARVWDDAYSSMDECRIASSDQQPFIVHQVTVVNDDLLLLSFTSNDAYVTSPNKNCVLQYISHLAEDPRICSIEYNPQHIEPWNDYAAMITQGGYRLDSTFNVIHRPWFDIGIDGSDEVLSVSDSGLDVDNCYFQSKNPLVRDGTIDMSQRKVVQYIPHFRNGDSYDAIDGHGTHVVGTVAGSRIDGKEGMADGIARGAKIAFFDMGEAGKCCSFQNSMDLLNTGRTGAQRQKASAMNMSWGARNNGVYNSMNAKFDTYMYENDDFLTVAAAGNSGMESGQSHILSSVGSPSSNKNGISVGASQSAGRDIYVGSMLGMDYLACFSSRGPTIDGRIKPDIVAPGFNILSARALPDEFGECDPDTRPGLLQSKEGLTFKAGTSMASPVVTGTTALVRQYLKSSYYNNQHSNPSSSLVKAVILNGGKDMKGAQDWFYGSDFIQVSPYDAHVGFGRVDLINSMPLPGSSLNAGFNLLTYDRIRIQPGDVQEYMFHIDDTCSSGTSELSVTLVWTDPPSESGCTRCLLNDIDLSLKINNGMTFFPNGKYGKDSVNNVERIRTNVQVGDEVHVSISGTNLSTEYQNYALVVTGCGLNSGEGTIPTVSPTDEPTSSPINKPSSSPTERLSLSPTDSNSNHPSSSPTESFSVSTSISTGYEGKELGNGNMFSISTKSSSITITGLSIHTNEKDIVGVEIYARDGSYGGYERRPTAWKSIGSTEVKGQGEGNPTPLPLNSFEPIHIEPQSTKSIYITLSNGFLSYSAGNGSIAPIASNDEIDIFEGCGKSYKFRATYEERRWNGDIKYRVHNKGVAKTKRPTTVPTKQPSLTIATESPSSESTGSYFLETVYNGSLASDGVMFNIYAQKNIRVMTFRIHTALNNMASLAIYIKSNSHMGYERRPKAWREVGRIDLECAGANKPTILPDELFDTIDILEGEMYSFYITILSSNNLILSSPGTQTGSEHISNKELILQEGVGKKDLFGATTSTRQFDGAVIYEILD